MLKNGYLRLFNIVEIRFKILLFFEGILPFKNTDFKIMIFIISLAVLRFSELVSIKSTTVSMLY